RLARLSVGTASQLIPSVGPTLNGPINPPRRHAAILCGIVTSACSLIFPRAGLKHYLDQETGVDAVSCGGFERHSHESRSLSGSGATQVAACMSDAFRTGRSAYFYVQGPGVDPKIAWGLLTRTGQLMRFDYDSAPCGSPACSERFVVGTCATLRPGQAITPDLPCS